MRILLRALVLAACFSFFAGFVHAEDVNVAFTQMKTELQKKGVSSQDLDLVEKPVKEMLGGGATKDEVKKFIFDLSGKGVKGADLQNAANSMNELVKNGEMPKQAGNVVSQAALGAKAQGLKGKDLAAKVREAVRQRKSEMDQAKKQLRQKQEEVQAKTEKARKDMEKKMQNQRREMNKMMKDTEGMKGMGGRGMMRK
ncbi:MAG: hypothetical protein V1674_04170 [Candidatus Omnitrophota bacterium]